ncbi:hypothetical protein, partial [Streptococcus pneumoniae]
MSYKYQLNLSIVSFKACISLLIFCLDDLSIGVSEVLKVPHRVPLVAQWLRVSLPMQGTWVRALVQEDPTCRG